MDVAGSRAEQDDWDRHWEDLESANLVNPAQEYRHHLVLKNLRLDGAANARVVDIGSGIGEFLRILHVAFPMIPKLGLEVSRSGVEIAARRLPQAVFLQRNLIAGMEDPGGNRSFATHAVCSEVLEHVDDPVRLLRNARPYMADGCRIVVTVPGGPQSRFDIHIGHRRHFTPAELHHILAEAGFDVEFCSGAGFPFFNLYRMVVILRGDKLVEDASKRPTLLLKFVSGVFRVLFRLNLSKSPLGWQILAVAYKRDAG
jgi:SAM-dependent methyltransferase